MKRIAIGTVMLMLASSSLAVAQAPGEPPEEPPAEPPPEEVPGEPEPAEPAPDAPVEPAPMEEPAPAEPAPEGADVGGQVELGAEGGLSAEGATGEAPPAEAPAPAEDTSEMIVTGTRIRTSAAFASSTPVEVIDRKQLEYSGATNLADVVQYLTVAQGSGFQGAGAGAGTVSINLRGLGAAATLVLLNGRRLNPSGGGAGSGFSDIGVIPLAAVERIEILKGGASSIYGSDAVGGVVNIITRKNFDGFRFEADGQTTDDFDQQDVTFNGAFGATSERSRVLVSVNYFRRNELTADERDWTTQGQHFSRQGFPATFIAPGLDGVGQTLYPDPGCNSAPRSMIVQEFVPMSATVMNPYTNEVCRFDFREFRSLVGNGERVNTYASGEHDLTDHTTIFAELTFSRLRGNAISSHYPFPPPFPQVPADHPDNPFGRVVSIVGRPFGAEDLNPPRNMADDDSVRVVAGLKGDFEGVGEDTMFESWEWELYASFGASRYRLLVHDNLRDVFVDALNGCSDLSEQTLCFNPFYSSVDGTGTPNSEAVKNAIKGQNETLNDHLLQTYNAGMSGGLFELPGGDLGIAFGTEVRVEKRSSELDHDSNQKRYAFLLGSSDAKAGREVYSGYLELRWPFYDGIELQTAGRAERYTDIEQTAFSPSAGLTLTPAEIAGRENAPSALHRLQLRGHVTSAFRGPSIYQSFPGVATVPAAFQPLGGGLPVFVPVSSYGNPDLDPEKALVLSGGVMWAPIPEINLIADYWHYNYTDRIQAESAAAKVQRWRQDWVDMGNMFAPGYVPPPGVRTANENVDLVGVDISQVNVRGDIVTHGLDFTTMLILNGETFGGGKDDWGTLSAGAIGTYTLGFEVPAAELPAGPIDDGTYDCRGTGTNMRCDLVPSRNGAIAFPGALPRLRINFPLTWTFSGHSASFVAHYISMFWDDVDTGHPGDFHEPIDAFLTFDLQYGYTLSDVIGKELTFRVGVYNLLDQDPPVIVSALDAFDPGTHDPRGRILYAKLISQF